MTWPVLAAATPTAPATAIVAGPFHFAAPTHIAIPDNPNGMVFAHLRSSKQLDIVTSDTNGKVSVLLSNGHGGFAAPTPYVVSTSFAVSSVVALDVTGDKRLDLVAVVKDPAGTTGLATLPGLGNGTFGAPIVTSTAVPGAGSQDTPVSVLAGNFLGTGRTVLTVGFAPGGANPTVVRIYPSLGDGHFGTASETLGIGSTYASASGMVMFPVAHGAQGVIVVDPACGFDAGSIRLLLNDGHGALTSAYSGLQCPANVVAVPLRHGKSPSLITTVGAVLQTPRHGVVLVSKGPGSFAPPASFELGATPSTVGAGDLLGKGVADVVASTGKSSVAIAHGHGDGTFDPPVVVPDESGNTALQVVDVTGDGRPDIVALDSAGITVLRNITPRHNGALSALARALATPGDAFGSASSVAAGSAIAIGGVLFITFPAELFNRTFDENYADIRGWWARRTRRWRRHTAEAAQAHPESALRRRLSFVLVLLIGALLGGLLDPRFGANSASAENYIATAAALTLAVAIPALAAAQFRRRRHREGRWLLHALPAGLLIAGGCVLVSRLVGFQPRYLYGVVASVIYLRDLDQREEGQSVALSSLARLLVSIVAWCAWLPVRSVADKPGAFPAWVVADDLLAAVFVAGLVSTAIGLLPLRFLPGWKVQRWHRGAWAVSFALAMFGVLQILVRSHSAERHQSSAPLVTTMVLFVVFGLGSVAFRDYFARRQRKLHGEPVPPLAVRLREIFLGRPTTPSAVQPVVVPVHAETRTASTAHIRAWARERGLSVSDRGRLPADVLSAWENDATT